MENQQEQPQQEQESKHQHIIIRVDNDEVTTEIKGDVVNLSSALASALRNENAGALVAIVNIAMVLSKNISNEDLEAALEHLDK